MNSSNLKPGFEPLEGYILRERLGAGGYGEVWRCDAPGGLGKAIKFIFGQVGGAQSERELKSLRRIAKVYHPFLLSIERIETVQQQTLIITELAESSLEDRLQACLKSGGTGIPRNELLEYFRDAADALDFLASEHSLQHLDVKPGNLLIVAKRIKVGDFGLLKDLNDIQMSSISGMTPAYSAPEVFDGRPDARSDQYSLAVAYVELLTGRLPFAGQTMAELAKQHISASPQLDQLPPADREVVARALLKDPFDRFANCRQFIDQLIKVKHSRLPQTVQATPVESRERQQTNPLTEIQGTSAPVLRPATVPTKRDESETPVTRCLFVGLGGLGSEAVASIKYRVAPLVATPDSHIDARWITIDTDRIEFPCDANDSLRGQSELSDEEKMELRLQSPDVYRRANNGKFNSLSRRWLYNIPRSRTTEGIRPLGLLALVHNLARVRELLTAKIRPLIQSEDFHHSSCKICVLSSLHGGTGSAMLPEIGLLIRDIVDSLCVGTFESRRPQVQAFVTLADVTRSGPARMAPAAAVASLSELLYHMSPNRNIPAIEARTGYSRGRPFDWVGLVHGGSLTEATDSRYAVDSLASVALTTSITSASSTLDKIRDHYSGDHWLRAMQIAPLTVAEHLPQESFAQFAAAQALGGTVRWIQQSGEDQPATQVKTLTQHLLALLKTDAAGDDAELTRSAWRERLSGDKTVRRHRMEADKAAWNATLRTALSSQQLTWHETEQASENAIDLLRSIANEGSSEFSKGIHTLLQCSPRDPVLDNVAPYLEELIENAQSVTRELVARRAQILTITREALEAISKAISPQIGRQIATQISHSNSARGLLSTVTSKLTKQLASLLPVEGPIASIDLLRFLQQSKEIARQAAADSDVRLIESKQDALIAATEVAATLQNQIPKHAKYGAEIARSVIAPKHKLDELRRLLPLVAQQHDVLSHTSLIPSDEPTDGPVVICEASNLPVGLIIQTALRPSGQLFDLAEKLRTRVDVEWPDIEQVLEVEAGNFAPVKDSAEQELADEGAVPPSLPVSSADWASSPFEVSSTFDAQSIPTQTQQL